MLSSVVGLPPDTLNSLEKVSTALNGDPNFLHQLAVNSMINKAR